MNRPSKLFIPPPAESRGRLRERTKFHSRPQGSSKSKKAKIEVKFDEALTHLAGENEISASSINQTAIYLKNLNIALRHDDRLFELVATKYMSLLYHENPLYRTMLYRLLRLTAHSYKHLLYLLLNQLDIHLLRSLDASECDEERREALQLICSLLYIYQKSPLKQFLHTSGRDDKEAAFTLFPKSSLKCITEIALDRLPRMLENLEDNKKPDKLSFACLAILVEFAIADPLLVLECAGTDWIVRAVVGPGATNSALATLVCRVLLKWLDTAEIREKAKLHLVMEQIFAPLIDLGFFHQNLTDFPKSDPPPMKINQILESVSTIFLSIFRSWTGVLSCGHVEENGDLASNSPFRLLHYLGLGTKVDITMVKIRNMVIDICCEFVDMPYSMRKFLSWDDALVYYARSHLPDRYKSSLRDDFVVAEMECLQSSGIFHPDVVDCLMSFRAAASYILINVGLPQALARLIMAQPNDPGGIKATLLLADLLRSGASFLPQDRRLMLLSAPSLVQAVSERMQFSAKLANGKLGEITFVHSDNAMLLLSRLDQLNDTSYNRLPLEGQLHNIELFVCGGKSLDYSSAYHQRERSTSQILPEDRLEHLFNSEPEFFSKVTAKELDLTRLDCIVDCLEWDNGSLLTKHRYNDKLHSFYSRIFTIILPQNYRFIKDSSSFNSQIIKHICHAVKILVPLAKTEPYYGELIEKFLHQCKEELDPEILYKGVFSPKNILNTCAHYYFAIIAAIGSSLNGIQLIEDAGIFQIFLDLLTSTTSIEYVKLIVSSLNYSEKGSFSRGIFETALTSTDEISRKWCTRFLGVIAGVKTVSDFGEWGMKLLIGQLGDRCVKVVRHAVRLLHFWLPIYPEALTFLSRSCLEPLGSAGILLKTHIYASEKIVSLLMEETREAIEIWLNSYHEEYVSIIEEDLKVALLNVKKSIKGTYARPSNEKYDKYGVPMPVHLFGQLARHQTGRNLLHQANIPAFLLKTLIESGVSTEAEILKVKAALLSLGHIAGNLPSGFSDSLLLPDTVAIICRFAEECPTLSVRGTSIWSLNLIGQTEDGARQLAFLGWESNRHTHVVDEVCSQFCDQTIISSKISRRRSRVKSLSSNIYCLDKAKSMITKSLSSNNLMAEASRPRSKSIEQRFSPLRRVLSDSQIALPIVGRKKQMKKKEKLTATKSVPYADTVRPDRTFTHESAVTSGFGSVSQDEHQHQPQLPHQNQRIGIKDLQQSVIVGSEYLQSPKIYRYWNHVSKFQEPGNPKKPEFAPSSMRHFTNPFIMPILNDKSGNISYSFIDNDLITAGGSIDSINSKPIGMERHLGHVDRELMVTTEAKVQQHFSSIYRNQHGISSFAQRTLLRIPNRTNSEVVYSFLSRSELKNIQNYHDMLHNRIAKNHDESFKSIGCIINWTVVALPCQIDLVLKKIFAIKQAPETDEPQTQKWIKHSEKGSAHRCFNCQSRIQQGKQITHHTSIDSALRNDILRFVSLFEIRGNFNQRQLLKQYGDSLQGAFENPCLYSDVIELMTKLNLSSQSRKQLHKLFSDAFILKE